MFDEGVFYDEKATVICTKTLCTVGAPGMIFYVHRGKELDDETKNYIRKTINGEITFREAVEFHRKYNEFNHFDPYKVGKFITEKKEFFGFKATWDYIKNAWRISEVAYIKEIDAGGRKVPAAIANDDYSAVPLISREVAELLVKNDFPAAQRAFLPIVDGKRLRLSRTTTRRGEHLSYSYRSGDKKYYTHSFLTVNDDGTVTFRNVPFDEGLFNVTVPVGCEYNFLEKRSTSEIDGGGVRVEEVVRLPLGRVQKVSVYPDEFEVKFGEGYKMIGYPDADKYWFIGYGEVGPEKARDVLEVGDPAILGVL